MSDLEELMRIALEKNPELSKLVDVVDQEVIKKLADGTLTQDQVPQKLEELANKPEIQSLPMFQTERGLPGLDPLVSAKIMERLQFDQDVPELRTGPMPADASPAVPVDTEAFNPLMLGLMLRVASAEVKDEMLSIQEDARKVLTETLEKEEGFSSLQKHSVLTELLESSRLDPKGYKRGSTPALRKQTVSTSALAQLSEGEKKTLSWSSIATTQGRKSSLKPMRRILVQELEASGFECVQGIPGEDECPVVKCSWEMSIGDRDNISEGFAPSYVAVEVLKKKLLAKAQNRPETTFCLVVDTIDDFSLRKVGWTASLYLP